MRVHDLIISSDLTSERLAELSRAAARFHSDIVLQHEQATVDVKSLLGMLLYPLKAGARVTVRTKGDDDEEALEFMCRELG